VSDDLDCLMKLDAADCLYSKPGRPPRLILDQAKATVGSKGYWLCLWALMGQLSGHEWCYCSECRAVRLMVPTGLKQSNAKTYTDDPPAAHAYCKLKPGCLGHMVRIRKRPMMTKTLRATMTNADQS
jgi:hypothetical protein